ncbi:hypothetical protein Tcan_18035 [Toxocara canis]|uniref:Uncharacterized protein n=1 Tax=Toxocara canis TaxID=6265 RepID=A0A0B2VJ62_TOXCA|nr:hypothetical protein Tcan_18035 [Toxocara canis]
MSCLYGHSPKGWALKWGIKDETEAHCAKESMWLKVSKRKNMGDTHPITGEMNEAVKACSMV